MTNPANLLELLNGEFSSLTIAFNDDHACSYATAQRWLDEWGFYGGGSTDDRIKWPSNEERLKAISENSVWTIQWYPNTPVAFSCVGASTFEAAAEFALSTLAEEKEKP
jgi:hypothetical protein